MGRRRVKRKYGTGGAIPRQPDEEQGGIMGGFVPYESTLDSDIGLLAPLPSLQMQQPGEYQASPAFPTGGFADSNTSGSHLRDRRGTAGLIPSYSRGGRLPIYAYGGKMGERSVRDRQISAGPQGSGPEYPDLLHQGTREEFSGLSREDSHEAARAGVAAGTSGGIQSFGVQSLGLGLQGYFETEEQIKREDAAYAKQTRDYTASNERTLKAFRQSRDAGALKSFATEGYDDVENFYVEDGGRLPGAQYEAEGGETIYHPNESPTAFNGSIDQIADNMSVVDGPSHAGGGVDLAGGKFAYSKKMKASKNLKSDLSSMLGYTPSDNSYAGIAESIGRKKGKMEDKLTSHDPISRRTGEEMSQRYDEALELVASEQEYRKVFKA